MASNEHRTGLEGDLSQAIDELHEALQHAADATASIQRLLPRVGTITGLFADLDNVIRAGREQAGIVDPQRAASQAYTRPTLLVPSAVPAPRAEPAAKPDTHDDAWAKAADAASQLNQAAEVQPGDDAPAQLTAADDAAPLVSFRLEFESKPGPLDLRTVDDAVSEHPAVRDVALLDYDGRKATLKVWIDGTASPADVQASLVERAAELFTPGNDVTIVALEDAA